MMLSQWCKLPLYLHDTSKKQILARCVNISSYNPIPNKQPLKLSLIVSVYYCTSISYFDDNITLFDHYCTFVTQFHYTRLVALWYFLFMHIVFVKTTTFLRNDVFKKCSCCQIDTENWIPYVISNELVYL